MSAPLEGQVVDGEKRRYRFNGTTYDVDLRYKLVRKVGAGAFGVVCEALDVASGERVAVKKISNTFEDVQQCKATLREIRLMRHFQHENIMQLRDIMLPEGSSWTDLYLVIDLMDADLHYIIHSGQPLSDGHIQFFTYQLLRGVKAIHSAGAIHRDLKPSNILVSKSCDLKITDFGQSRAVAPSDDPDRMQLTEYICTRWYRAPELLCQNSHYGPSVDMWSVGCILAECLGRTVLFPGKEPMMQLRLIVELIGTPHAADLETIQNPMAIEFLRTLSTPPRAPKPLLPGASPAALALLAQLLQFDPRKRLSAAVALAHPYLSVLHELNSEPDASAVVESFEDLEAAGIDAIDLRSLVWAEMAHFHPEVGPVPPSFTESPARVMDLAMAVQS